MIAFDQFLIVHCFLFLYLCHRKLIAKNTNMMSRKINKRILLSLLLCNFSGALFSQEVIGVVKAKADNTPMMG